MAILLCPLRALTHDTGSVKDSSVNILAEGENV